MQHVYIIIIYIYIYVLYYIHYLWDMYTSSPLCKTNDQSTQINIIKGDAPKICLLV